MNTNLQGDFQICISVPLNETEKKVKLIIALILLGIYILQHVNQDLHLTVKFYFSS